MPKPTINATTGLIDFKYIMFNNTAGFMRTLAKSLSEIQETGSKNIPFKTLVIGTNSAINLNKVPDKKYDKYSNEELKNAVESSTYTMSGYTRKEDTYNNATVYLMLQNGYSESKIYDAQKNNMVSMLLGG